MRFILLLFFLLDFISKAQIVNVENMRLATKNEGFTGSIDLSLNFTMNSVQLLQIGDRARIGYKKKKHQILLLTDHSLIRTNSLSIVNLGF